MVHRVVVAAYAGTLGYELGFVTEVFGLHRPGVEVDYRFQTCAVEDGPLRTTHGHLMATDASIDEFITADTVIVAGWRDVEEPAPESFRAALQQAHTNGARVIGICSGVFPLADAGLLDGQTVTTHWLYADTLRRRHPHLDVDPAPLYVIGDNHTATSAGSSAGLDLCLALVTQDYGVEIATQIANRMVVTHHRPGTQTQFVPHGWHAAASVDGDPLGSLLTWIDENLHRSLTIDDLAEHVLMSRRTLIRRFSETTGTTPGAWIVDRRVAEVRRLLETTSLSVKAIAQRSGIGTPTNLRKHLMTSTGLTPTQYRTNHRH